MRKIRSTRTTVNVVNGWDVVRQRIGEATWWCAEAICPDGYHKDIHYEGSRKEVEKWAAENVSPIKQKVC